MKPFRHSAEQTQHSSSTIWQKAGSWLSLFELWTLVALLAAMVGVAVVQVILRNFFNSGIDWADVAVRHLVLWVGLLGASVAARKKRHLSIDIAARLIPERFAHLVESLLCMVTTACCAMFLWASVRFAEFMYEYGTGTLEGGWALLACLILPISFLGISIRFLVRMLLEIRTFISGLSRAEKGR